MVKLVIGENDLVTVSPDLVNEWDYEKNDELGIYPNSVTKGSHKYVWWKCSLCGHRWQSTVHNRSKGRGCPKCGHAKSVETRASKRQLKSKDFGTTHPELLTEWDYTTNNSLGIFPEQIAEKSNKNVGWVCANCNNKWLTSPANRVKGTGCPECAKSILLEKSISTRIIKKGSLLSSYPELLPEWNYEDNKLLGINPDSILAGSGQKVFWRCPRGHVWKAAVYSRVAGNGCPVCKREISTSFPEQAIMFYLGKVYPDAINGDRDTIYPHELDIYIPSARVAVEYDGAIWHTNVKKDCAKDSVCKEKGITLYRIREKGCPDIESEHMWIHDTNDMEQLNEIIRQLVECINGVCEISIDVDRDRSQIYAQYIIDEKERSFGTVVPELLAEWNYEKNGGLNPDTIRASSEKKVWWKCPKGHDYQARVGNRVHGRNCPVCSGKQVLKGYNDLLSQFPEIAAEWNHERNSIAPDEVYSFSNKKVWWKCSKGHEWLTGVLYRTKRNRGCPFCANQRIQPGFNDLATVCPELLSEWNYEKNDAIGIFPTMVSRGTQKKVWWRCKYGHEYISTINNRTRLDRNSIQCPICRKKTREPR